MAALAALNPSLAEAGEGSGRSGPERVAGRLTAAVWVAVGAVVGAAGRALLGRRRRDREVARLEDLTRRKDDLLAAASHELRGPLTSVLGFARTLQDGEPPLSDTERAEILAYIVEEAEEMQAMVEDLLATARLDRGAEVRVSAAPLGDVAAEVRGVVERLVLLRGVEVAVTGNASVLADVGRLRQIVRNLLINAATHGAPPITVAIEPDGQVARIVVRDSGKGIPSEIVEAMFDRDRSAPDIRGGVPSTGVGLWLSRELAVRMDGALAYVGGDDETAFELTLPSPRFPPPKVESP